MVWNPSLYMRFGNHRLRPALDLISAVNLPTAKKILDLGCGPGNITEFLLERWPEANVLGIDSSPEMIDAANKKFEKNDRAKFEVRDMTAVDGSNYDLIYSNAAIHWLPSSVHKTFIPKLLSLLKPGGVLAVQMPDTRLQPSHVLMFTAAQDLGLREYLEMKKVRIPRCDEDPAFYYNILKPLTSQLDLWTTNYVQILSSGGPGPYNYVKSTGLMPVEQAIKEKGADVWDKYEAHYKSLLDKAYPPQENGEVLFPYNRFFIVCQKN
eukprot:Colp12_sorted_trinity150504_noHs@26428